MDLSPPVPLALAHLTALDVPPPELVTLASAAGYAAVGLRLYPAFAGSRFYSLPAGSAAIREVRQRLDDTGVTINDIEFIGIGAEFDVAALDPLLDTGAELGARCLSVCGDDPDRARLTANFARLCERAAPLGLRVELEFMAWRAVARFGDAFEVVSAARQANGGVLIDALHVWRTGGSERDIGTAPPSMIRTAQLCDAAAERPATPEALLEEARAGRLAPGRGALPLAALLAALPDDTALSLEVPTGGQVPIERHVRDVFDATQALIGSLATVQS
ncbi:sugar phosphate isomerase/epimerase family protein [Burkholderia ubonensis]|uniref:sugar phosphate isomerase/epimerase family protein n=1 Tax=Burkholderia ubonensis TaxID=101571 RepID=UPI002AAF4601|nr:TIM barrel protein [Burkholderia ubonensis]